MVNVNYSDKHYQTNASLKEVARSRFPYFKMAGKYRWGNNSSGKDLEGKTGGEN